MPNREKSIEDPYLSSGWHYQYGWLRRPELDDENGFAYEEGDGDLIFTKRVHHSVRAYLDCWRDAKTGEKYLTFTHLPASCWAKATK